MDAKEMPKIDILVGDGADERLAANDIRVIDLIAWTREFLAQLGISASELGEVRCFPGAIDARSTYGSFYPDCREIVVYLPGAFQAEDIKATLIHELAHLAQVVRGCQSQPPETGDACWGSWEFAVLYYATSQTEIEALAWEVTVFPARMELLQAALRARSRMRR